MSLREWVPRWWAGDAGAAGRVLTAATLPAEAGFRAASGLRNALYDRGLSSIERVPVPVISVGNVAVGGAGKTPFSAWLVRRLSDWGRRPAIVMRGYGEDEVLLHRELNPDVPVFANVQRIVAAREAVAAGCDVIVLDDGFQHRALRRDLDIVLVSAEGWTGRRRLLPRGPWREPVTAMRRAQMVVVTRKSASPGRSAEVAAELQRLVPGVRTAECSLSPSRLVSIDGARSVGLDWLTGRRVLAVSALADPRPFLAHLQIHAADAEAATYPDHHAFTGDDVRAILARASGRPLVMTHKDAVKLRPLLGGDAEAFVLEQSVEITSGGDVLDGLLRGVLQGDGG
ncbi:MAG TPA: tetraacyldisaccharide 4'-kinase [Longimicrobiaceae bacterium]|nr:tetraacyldisaccharide 4'-kinase [Longimicrobiaceae bacterium]